MSQWRITWGGWDSLPITNLHVVKASSLSVFNSHLGGAGTSEVTFEYPPGRNLLNKHWLLEEPHGGLICLTTCPIKHRLMLANQVRERHFVSTDEEQKFKNSFNSRPGHAVAQLAEALALQAGRSRVRFPMVSLEFFIDTILQAAIRPWGPVSL